MAEAVGLASGLLTLATFAFHSGIALVKTVKEFRSHPKHVRDLIEELDALCGALTSLTDAVNTEIDVDLSALKLPLLQCGNACDGFRAEIAKCSSRSVNGRTSFRDWARLRYIGDDITTFTQSISGYKSTIIVALTDATFRKTCITAETLEGYRNLIKNATDDLEARLESIDEKLNSFCVQNSSLDEPDGRELQFIEAERLSTKNCLQICAQLAEHVNQAQLSYGQGDSDSQPIGLDTSEIIMNEGLKECQDSLAATIAKLEGHMQSVIDRLVKKSKGTGTTADDQVELEGLRDQWETARQCMSIFSKADKHLKEDISVIENYAVGDATQLMVSANGRKIHGTNRGLGWRTKQLGGYVSDSTIQQVSRDFSTVYFQSTDGDGSAPHHEVQAKSDGMGEHDQQPSFSGKYGKGRTVTDLSR